VLGRERLTPTGLLLLLFSLHAGLYAVRNIPISAIIMSLVLGPPLTLAISPGSDCHPVLDGYVPCSTPDKVSRTV
jgi:hypothetical protein